MIADAMRRVGHGEVETTPWVGRGTRTREQGVQESAFGAGAIAANAVVFSETECCPLGE